MYQTVIFDLDGTLLDTIQDLAEAGNRTLDGMGLPNHTTEEYLAMVGHGIPALIHVMLPEQARTPDRESEALALFSRYYRAHGMEHTRPYPGIPELLQDLRHRGIALGICSNKADEFTQALTAHYFPGLLDRVRGKLPGVPAKPDPTAVRLLLKDLQAAPAAALYVGDSDTDMETGRNAGLTTCGVTWGFRSCQVLSKAGADSLAHSARELEQLILG